VTGREPKEPTGIELITVERFRQIHKEGFTAEHDDEHTEGELARAAACYASPVRIFERYDHAMGINFVDPWPVGWDECWDKRGAYGENRAGQPSEGSNAIPDPATYSMEERIDLLVKAGALIAAEIDRLLRLK
jgi:hypothetical protein